MRCTLSLAILLVLAQPAWAGSKDMQLKSSAFALGGPIPSTYTCQGADISPPLAWSGLPKGTVSLALVCEDPDAPAKTWVHWLLYNVPATRPGLGEHLAPTPTLEDGSRQGTNDFGKIGYGGPCPPSGTHRYMFRLYALDASLDLAPGARRDALDAALKGHVLAETRLMGTYRKTR